jgi:hypothetical protein
MHVLILKMNNYKLYRHKFEPVIRITVHHRNYMGLCICDDVDWGCFNFLYCYYSRDSVDMSCVICFNVCLNCVITEILFTRTITRDYVAQN